MEQDNSNRTLTHVIYGLYAFSLFLGFTAVIAVIINYVKRPDVAGTRLESHFLWQIRTFWWGLLWTTLGSIAAYFLIGIPILIAAGIWFLYRVIRGWIRLNDNKEMYTQD